MDDQSPNPPHVRRKRYRGTHPRHFSEKYKEHDPQKYKADVDHVISRGDTPAGTHRSICMVEVLDILNPQPGETAVDATTGYGGHSREILNKIRPNGLLYGIDVDPVELQKTTARLQSEGFGPQEFIPLNSNYEHIGSLLAKQPRPKADMVLADLGVSSMQIDNPDRGFTYKRNGPLDMRMNQQTGETASRLLDRISEDDLCRILTLNADEPDSQTIAAAIKKNSGIETTRELTQIIKSALLRIDRKDKEITKSTRRTYQAIRIAVNHELSALDNFLLAVPDCLLPGGRFVILTFHSGEDNRVVESFQHGFSKGLYSQIFSTEIRGSFEEQYTNPRSKSVKLRWAIKA